MAFTYTGSLTNNLEKARLGLGDTQPDNGPRPMRRNFTDGEINYFLSAEGDRLNGAIAMGYEVLAGEWGSYAQSERNADKSRDASNVSAAHRLQAKAYRDKPGGTVTTGGPGIVLITRSDAYSD